MARQKLTAMYGGRGAWARPAATRRNDRGGADSATDGSHPADRPIDQTYRDPARAAQGRAGRCWSLPLLPLPPLPPLLVAAAGRRDTVSRVGGRARCRCLMRRTRYLVRWDRTVDGLVPWECRDGQYQQQCGVRRPTALQLPQIELETAAT